MEQLAALCSGVQTRRHIAALSPPVVLAAFAATLLLSAFLMFFAKPMFAKMALPALGGTHAIWAVSMYFFQAVLLAEYVYAHTLNRHLKPRRAVLVHVAFLGIAVLALPIGLPAIASNPPSDGAYLWLLGVLALGIGLPHFAISANAPPLQAWWFSRTGRKGAIDPYLLYGAGNAGSLMALVSHPIAIEPRLGLMAQSGLWSVGYFALAALIAACGSIGGGDLKASSEGSESEAPQLPASAGAGASASTRPRLSWIALAAIPSGLMVAVTTYITTDVASAPLGRSTGALPRHLHSRLQGAAGIRL